MRPGATAVTGVIFALAGLSTGCGPEASAGDAPIDVTDGAGRSVRLEEPARRIVSTVPALTDWVVALGAAERLVARTEFDAHPDLSHLPSVGGGLDPSVEWLAAQRPDLVLAWPDAPSRSLVARLDRLGIATYTAPIQTIGDALAVATDIGRLLGAEIAAAEAVARVRVGLDAVEAAVAARPRPSVLFLIGLEPIMAAGPGTFLDELLTRAGGRNALGDLPILWPNLSLEEVVRRAPDVIIVGSAGPADPLRTLRSRPGWRDVRAVQDGRVHGVDPDVINRPGPHLHDAAAQLARLVHPGAR
jgi:ABC-type Fe3+-hydroxamate transport system substrate-binding protein